MTGRIYKTRSPIHRPERTIHSDDDRAKRFRASMKEAAAKEVADELDDLLDEVDAVLEENAEEFVRGYVQKGGQ